MKRGSVQYQGTIPVYVEPRKAAPKQPVRAEKRTPTKKETK